MIERDIEKTAEDILVAHEIQGLPVDPFAIAQAEGIELLAGSYDDCFDGRIEYRRQGTRGQFYLFYAEEKLPGRPEGRVRFSIAHELAHFYLPKHRQYLLSGNWHGSHSGFVSDKPTEREADQFAASLLMPESRFAKIVATKGMKVCTMNDLVQLANKTFHTSLTSTVIRYVQLCFEPCCVVLSKNGRTVYSVASEDLRLQGLGWVGRDTVVPPTSITGQILGKHKGDEVESTAGAIDADVWFEGKPAREMWEEVKVLGRTGLSLTFLALSGSDD